MPSHTDDALVSERASSAEVEFTLSRITHSSTENLLKGMLPQTPYVQSDQTTFQSTLVLRVDPLAEEEL